MIAVLLDAVFLSALQSLLGHSVTSPTAVDPHGSDTEERVQQNFSETKFKHSLSPGLAPVAVVLNCHALTCQAVYRHAQGVASLMSLAASCLCQPSGRLVYLGADTLGVMWSVSRWSVGRSISQSVDQSVGRSVSRSVSRLVGQSVCRSM